MGLLTIGKALSPEEVQKISLYIRQHGVLQFLATWNRVKDIADDELKFGDEIECGVFVVDSSNKTVKLSVRAAELLHSLEEKEADASHMSEGCTWHPEFGGWMVESTPSRPYGNYASDLLRVEKNMILRRRRLMAALGPNEIAPYIPCFPLMGVGDFIHQPQPFSAPFSQSSFVPDYIVNPHPRFAALATNIRSRRGSKVHMAVPLFQDSCTPEFKRAANPDTFDESLFASTLPPGHALEPDTFIHMDAMAFGMGMCCLQVTLQARDVDESRYMYDQLAVLAPIMLAMTAATPFFKGRLADIDVRWDIIAGSVDCRTPAEMGLIPEFLEGEGSEGGERMPNPEYEAARRPGMAGDGVRRIPKSRYGSVSTYIYRCLGDHACAKLFEMYNDIPCPVDESVKTQLLEAGVDHNLAHHVAHLFIRDPLVVFEGIIELDDERFVEHFENIQSTNWQTCRWKPPPPRNKPDDPHIGWRTEFRSMEVQLTDFENAAFTVFSVLVTRVVLAFDLALYIPLSKVDENMRRATGINAVNNQRFYFRKNLLASSPGSPVSEESPANGASVGTGSSAPAAASDGHDTHRVLASAAALLTPNPTAANMLKSVSTTNLSLQSPDGATASTSDSWECLSGGAGNRSSSSHAPTPGVDDMYEEMTMNEIFNGKCCYFPGLIPLVYAYLTYIDADGETFQRIDMYLQFISKRAKGETVTAATYFRQFITSHPAYKHDSVISPEIAHDLLQRCTQIGDGRIACPEVLGNIVIDRVNPEGAYGTRLAGRLSVAERSQLLASLMKRADGVRSSGVPHGTAKRRSCSLDLDMLDLSPRGSECAGAAAGAGHVSVAESVGAAVYSVGSSVGAAVAAVASAVAATVHA